MYKLSVLKNGIKVVTHNMPMAHGVTTSIFWGVGSRYENDRVAGVSHFLEHMFFKGTKNRPKPEDIARSIESVGGYLNAATSQESTIYYNRMPSAHSERALEVLADMMNNSLFEAEAMERERGVILEELNMYLDTPIRYISDLMMNLTFEGNTLGRDIIGTRESLKNMRRQDLIDYIKKHYQPQRMVVSVAGKLEHKKVVGQVTKYFGKVKPASRPKYSKVGAVKNGPRVLVHYKKTDQAHLAMSFRALPYNHKDIPVLTLLDTILGSGMSSRLFLNIREKLGLCYYVNSGTDQFEDTGLFAVNAGVNIEKTELAIRAIWEELQNIAKIKVSKKELAEAKECLRGGTSLEIDNTDNMAIWYGTQALFGKNIKTPEQKIKELLRVSENDIMKLARGLFQRERINLALIGPVGKKEKFLKFFN
ncbi:insulinase family protein [Candidatus Kuenenbacteria bacterium]|nr:insulinase family protein [Candidatus Kuenenbacteria bacterium]